MRIDYNFMTVLLFLSKKTEGLFCFFCYSFTFSKIAFQDASIPVLSTDEKRINVSAGSKFSFFLIADSCLFHFPRGIFSAFVATRITGIS